MTGGRDQREPWLPDLCRLPRLLVMLGMAELIVVVLALAPDGGSLWNGRRFLSASGFALWLALSVSVLLCLSRRGLSNLAPGLGGMLAALGAAVLAATVAATLHVIDAALGIDLVPEQVPFRQFCLGTAAVTLIAVGVVLRYLYVNDGWKAQVQASARAEVDALQARIKPHFLFNSMNTIASLVRRDPVLAERAVLDLSDLFRAALGAGESGSTLAQEIELVEQYLAIEQLRLGERLRVVWNREEPLPWSLAMPRLLLQPLAENAIQHGVARLAEGGAVEIDLVHVDGFLRVRIRNPAPASPEQALDGPTGARHAQSSIAYRLTYAYGPQARMTTGRDGGYYLCELHVPTGVGALTR